MSSTRAWRNILERFGPLAALLALIAGTAIIEHFKVADPADRAFLTARNFANIFGQWSYVGFVALGMTFVIILGGIDLSVGALVAVVAGGAVYALNAAVEQGGFSPGLAVAVGCAVCLLAGPLLGLINGFMISKGRLAPFVATLGTLAIYRSLILAPSDGSEIRSSVSEFATIGAATLTVPFITSGDSPVNIRVSVIVLVVCAVLAQLLLSRTVFGRQVFAIGDNAVSARYAGIRADRITMLVYALCGLGCGIAALFQSSRLNSVSSSTLGLYYELDAIAAVVIGGTRLQGGAGSIFGTVVGVLIMGVTSNMLNMLDVSTHYQGLVKGCIIIGAVLLQRLLSRGR